MWKNRRIVFGVAVFVVFVISAGVFTATTGTGSVTPTAGGVSAGGIADVSFASSGQPSWSPIAGASGSITAGDLYTADSTGSNPYTGDVFFTLYLNNGDELTSSYSYFTSQINVKMLSSQAAGEAVGTGNGTTTVFLLDNAPVAPTTLVVKVNSVTQTEDTDYTVNYKTGTITFISAPGNTLAVTADYWFNDPTSGTTYKQASTASGLDIADTFLTLSNGFVSFVVAGDSGGAKYKVTVDDGSFYCISTSGTLGPTYYLAVDQG